MLAPDLTEWERDALVKLAGQDRFTSRRFDEDQTLLASVLLKVIAALEEWDAYGTEQRGSVRDSPPPSVATQDGTGHPA